MRSKPVVQPAVYQLVQVPIGWLALVGGLRGLIGILSSPDRNALERSLATLHPGASVRDDAVLDATRTQLQEFFRGRRRDFDLPIDFSGLSPFAVRVLQALQTVAFGATLSYGQLAAVAGHPGAARAVGRVMAHNPFPIVIPCHRVLGAGGAMTGYSGGAGIPTKQWLLEFEKRGG